MNIIRRLPAPKDSGLDVADASLGAFKTQQKDSTAIVTARGGPPPYGKRQAWAPRNLADFGDGGAFPEIHVAQYPLDMGKSDQALQKVVPLMMDENGNMAWDAVIKQGAFKAGKLAVHTKPEDMREKWSKAEELTKPSEELDNLNTERTQKALELALNGKIQSELPKRGVTKEPEFVRYTPNPDAPGYTPNCSERVIRITERQKDPFEPPKFKHKKVPRGPPSPPPPVMHSPARKLTAKDQKDWKIPPCISNWKNAKGYTIPLDKRLAADGRNLQDVAVNDKFAALSEDLFIAERKAREEIKIRNDMVRQKKVREEEVREVQLRDLAAQARTQRAELASKGVGDGESAQDAAQRQQRMEVLNDRKREIEREQRLELAGKKGKLVSRDADRDISERIALGQVAQPTSQEAQFDSRLFNQSAGLDSGYHGGSDEVTAVYDKPLFADRSEAGIYKYDKERMEQAEGRLGHIGGGNVSNTKAFGGAADPDADGRSAGPRTVPVEFERDEHDDGQVQTRGLRGDARSSGDLRERRRSRTPRRSPRPGRDGDSDDDRDGFGLEGLLEETRKKR